MKELSIEQKAQRYDKAIEKAKGVIEQNPLMEYLKKGIEYIFPELKESEDERIRKWLVEELYKSVNSSISKGFDIDMGRKALAWLEKQGNLMKALQISNARIGELIEKNYYLKEQLEKQGEQKTDDRVEQKFKVGDWINGYYTNYKVLSVNNEGYEVEDTDGNKINILFENEKFHHLWTIQDAKNGDVLATDSWLYMFKYTNNKALIQFHCKCPINGKTYKWSFLSDDSYLDIYIDANIHPATKEQRDLLFQRMKEAGYEWDAKKKELKKIEQKPAWSEEMGKLCLDAISLLRDYASGIDKNGQLGKKISRAEAFLSDLYHNAFYPSTYNMREDLRKSEWSEEDERMYRGLHNLIYSTSYCDSRKEFSDFLNSLKDRVQIKPQQEWSEEDEKCIRLSTDIIDSALRAGFCVQLDRDRCVDWLKSLRPQNTWKPSDEQMKAFDSVLVYNPPCSNECRNHLITLYNDLEKLRKE